MLVFVPTPIGNLEDITLRALRALSECDVVLCEDTRVASSLFALLEQRSLLPHRKVRFMSVHSHNEKSFVQNLDPSFFEQNIIYVSDAGMPCVSDPGVELVRYAQNHNIPYTILPGANAALCAFVASGYGGKEFYFYGFLPHKRREKEREIARLVETGGIVVCYESPHRLLQTLAILRTMNVTEVFAAKEISKHFEKFFWGNPAVLLDQIGTQPKGEWTLVLNLPVPNIPKQLSLENIADLLPPRTLAKIKARISGQSVQECYNALHTQKEENSNNGE